MKEDSLRKQRPPEETPEVLEKMDSARFAAGLRAIVQIAMSRGGAKVQANPGLERKQ